MIPNNLRNRHGLPPSNQATLNLQPDLGAGATGKAATEPHPGGQIKHGLSIQILRMLAFATWTLSVIVNIHTTQILGSPVYFIDKDLFYSYMAWTKMSFGIVITTVTAWFSPTKIRVSGDNTVRGQLVKTEDGRLRTKFPERLVLIANHQIYTDWLYLWWTAYTSYMHGHVYIILKESLKYIPFIGPGMMFYNFIFLARNWAKDKTRLHYRLTQLKKVPHGGRFSGIPKPMWLLIFPEGTNLSDNTRAASARWAQNIGAKDYQHQIFPRSTGLQYCLQELKGTVDWVYDCTVAYEGVQRGAFGEEIFTLRSTLFQGRPPKSVNMYWRRVAVSSIPVDDDKKFEQWLQSQWRIKDDLLEQFHHFGRFPADDGYHEVVEGTDVKTIQGAGYIETEVKLAHWYEIGQIFVALVLFAFGFLVWATLWSWGYDRIGLSKT